MTDPNISPVLGSMTIPGRVVRWSMFPGAHADNINTTKTNPEMANARQDALFLIRSSMIVSYQFFKTMNPGRCSLRKFKTSE